MKGEVVPVGIFHRETMACGKIIGPPCGRDARGAHRGQPGVVVGNLKRHSGAFPGIGGRQCKIRDRPRVRPGDPPPPSAARVAPPDPVVRAATLRATCRAPPPFERPLPAPRYRGRACARSSRNVRTNPPPAPGAAPAGASPSRRVGPFDSLLRAKRIARASGNPRCIRSPRNSVILPQKTQRGFVRPRKFYARRSAPRNVLSPSDFFRFSWPTLRMPAVRPSAFHHR